jgi:hypothetical protein
MTLISLIFIMRSIPIAPLLIIEDTFPVSVAGFMSTEIRETLQASSSLEINPYPSRLTQGWSRFSTNRKRTFHRPNSQICFVTNISWCLLSNLVRSGPGVMLYICSSQSVNLPIFGTQTFRISFNFKEVLRKIHFSSFYGLLWRRQKAHKWPSCPDRRLLQSHY